MRTLFAGAILASGLAAQIQTVGIWTHPSTALIPRGRTDALLAFDAARGRTVLTGGLVSGPADHNVYEFDGASWRAIAPVRTILSTNHAVRLCYAAPRGRVLAVRSELSVSPTPIQLYEWSGSDWLPIAATNAPRSRSDSFALAFDEARNVLVLFGGGLWWADTWEWDGSAWTQLGTGGPPGRRRHQMVYDVARQRTVLFGGVVVNGNGTYDDTWEWDGQVWRERFGIAPPAVQGVGSGMAYDRRRQRTVLFGGISTQTNLRTNALHEYDGSGWTPLPHFGDPPAVYETALAYDDRRDRMVAFGGSLAGAATLDTWELDVRTGTVASFAFHGAGCASPAGVPTLQASQNSRPRLGSTLHLRYGNLPNTPLALVFAVVGFDDQSWQGAPLPLDLGPLGMPGCFMRLAPAIAEPLANLGGTADHAIAVPAEPALEGLWFFVQGAVLSSSSNAAGLVVSDAGRGLVGAL